MPHLHSRLGSRPLPYLHRDWAHRCPHLHWDWARRCHLCTGTGPGRHADQTGTLQAAHKYAVGMRDFVRRPSLALSEFVEPRLAVAALGLDMFISHRRQAKRLGPTAR